MMRKNSREPLKVAFILSRGHSGSTLLDTILDSHSKIVGLGECEKVSDKIERENTCACGALVKSCPFWSFVHQCGRSFIEKKVRCVARTKRDFILNRKNAYRVYSLVCPAPLLEEYVNFNLCLFRSIRQETHASVLVDSSKNPDRLEALVSHGKGEIQPLIIHIVRDGRAVAWSYRKKYGGSLLSLLQWMTFNLKLEITKLRFKGPVLFVHYHNLVSLPERECKRICSFLGVPYQASMVEYWNYDHHQCGGNPRPMREKVVAGDEEWRSRLPLLDRMLFALFCGWLNRWYYLRAYVQRLLFY